MSCVGSTLSFMFMLLSFIAMCLCGAVAGFGMFYFVSATSTMAAFGLFDLGVLLAISGSSMFMVKFLGLCGTAMESKWITRFFYGFLCVGLVLQGAGGVYALIREAKVNTAAEQAWFSSSELVRETIQKKNMCCGFFQKTEDIRCTHLYHNSCGERLVELQASSLKMVSALIFITTVVDVFLLVISIFLAKIYDKQEKTAKQEREQRQRVVKTGHLRP